MNTIFLTVLNMSITGSFVIAAVCIARMLLKRAPKSFSYLLWLVVGFRLLFPFSIESVFSLIPFNPQPIPQNVTVQVAPPPQGIPPVQDVVSTPGYGLVEGGLLNIPATSNLPALPGEIASTFQLWPNVFAAIWLAGLVIMVAYGTISYYMLCLKMRKSGKVGNNIYKSGKISSPFVLGLIKPKIYLPPMLKNNELDYILLHEQTHIGRRDHIIKLGAYFVLALHWFNPLAWVAFLLMEKDMEMSCDEIVLRQLGGEIKKDYSLTLLSLATNHHAVAASPLAFGEGSTKERVKNVLNFRRPTRIFAILAVILVIALSIGLAMNRTTGNAAEPNNQNYDNNDTVDDNESYSDTAGSTSLPEAGTPYVGAAHETSRIVNMMPLPREGWSVWGIEIGTDHGTGNYAPYSLIIYYEPVDQHAARRMGGHIPESTFEANAAFLFEHIGNLQEVTFSVSMISSPSGAGHENYFYHWSLTRNGEQTLTRGEYDWWDWAFPEQLGLERHAGALTGPIVIVDNMLHIDLVELLFQDNEADMARFAELHPHVDITDRDHVLGIMPRGFMTHHLNSEIIWRNDYERIAELGLDVDVDFPEDEWEPYTHMLGMDTLSFEITDATIFEFVDTDLRLSDTDLYGTRVRAVGVNEFLAARSDWGLADPANIGASTFRRVVYFVQVNDQGQVVSVTEEFFLTQ